MLFCFTSLLVKASDPIIYHPQFWCEYADLYDKNNIWKDMYEEMVGIVIDVDRKNIALRIGTKNYSYTIVSFDRVKDLERWKDENVFVFKALVKDAETRVLFVIRAETKRVKIFLCGNNFCTGWMETN